MTIIDLKIGQRHDVWANVTTFQRVIKKFSSNVETLKLNVTTFQRTQKSNVTTLISNVALEG